MEKIGKSKTLALLLVVVFLIFTTTFQSITDEAQTKTLVVPVHDGY
jgi:hypothetical protein